VIPSAILGRYARSLADVAFEDNLEQEVSRDIETFREIFRAVPELAEAFHAPAVPRETKDNLLAALVRRYPVHPVTANFLRVLLGHNRMRFYPQIADAYRKAVDERRGVVEAAVTAAAPLTREELAGLESRLAGVTGKRVRLEPRTDASLLGGVVVRVGSTVFDGSIRTQLSEMKRRLTENR